MSICETEDESYAFVIFALTVVSLGQLYEGALTVVLLVLLKPFGMDIHCYDISGSDATKRGGGEAYLSTNTSMGRIGIMPIPDDAPELRLAMDLPRYFSFPFHSRRRGCP